MPPTPIAFWNFDDTAGTANTAVDAVTGTYPLTRSSAGGSGLVFASGGKIGNYLEYASSVDRYLQHANNAVFQFGGLFSFSCWIVFNSTSSTRAIFERWGNSQNSYLLRFSGNQLQFFTSSNGTNDAGVSVSWTPSTGVWYHLGLTKNGTSVKFYVNGAQQGTTQTMPYGTPFVGTSPFRIGTSFNGGTASDWFFGGFDAMGVWNSELTSGNMSALYNGGAGLQYPFITFNPAIPRRAIL